MVQPPPGGPQWPSGALGSPGFGGPAHAGPGISAASPAPKQRRGCAIVGIASLAVIALLLVAAGVWAIVALSGAGSDYAQVPGCDMAENKSLDQLVSDHESEVDQPIEDLGGDRDGRECRWATSEDAESVPSAARLVMVAHEGHGDNNGEEDAAAALRSESKEHSPESIAKLGDKAFSWYESDSDFEWGCVGVRMSNLYVSTCYTSSVDFQGSESIPEDEVVAAAEDLARDVVQRIEHGDF